MSDLNLSQKESIAIYDDSKYFKHWTDIIIRGKGNFMGWQGDGVEVTDFTDVKECVSWVLTFITF